jgi:hypothetical protein
MGFNYVIKMVKRCIVCNADAKFKIKDTSDYYCHDCAEENFSDLTMLLKLEDEAQKLKQFLKLKMVDLEKDQEALDQMISINEVNSLEDE